MLVCRKVTKVSSVCQLIFHPLFLVHIPADKHATIAHLNVPVDQKNFVVHDHHHSHGDKKILEMIKSSKLLTLCIPKRCVDITHVYDTVVILVAVNEEYIKWIATNPDKAQEINRS